MYVIKRDGKQVPIRYDEITDRNVKIVKDLGLNLDVSLLSQTIIRGLANGMTTRDIDRLTRESAIFRSIYEPEFADFAIDIAADDLHKSTPKTLEECLDRLKSNVNAVTGKANPLIDEKVYQFAKNCMSRLEKSIIKENDRKYTYFGFCSLEKSYLQKGNTRKEIGKDENGEMQYSNLMEITETPQYMLMRVALGIHGPSTRNGIVHKGNINKVIECYISMSNGDFTPATPTLFYFGTPKPTGTSCFLLSCADSMEEKLDGDGEMINPDEPTIPMCWEHSAKISKGAGGIGIDLTPLRCRGSYIAGTNGRSNGIIPAAKVFNEIGRYVDQCFHPDTIVYTTDGPKRIDDVDIGDKVITNDGTVQEVLQLKWDHTDEEDLYGIGVKHSIEDVYCTDMHPFYTIQNVATGISFDIIKSRLDRKTIEPEYVESSKLNIGDLIGFPIPTYEKDFASFSEEDCWFYGIMVGDGHFERDSHQAYVSLNYTTKFYLIDLVKQYLASKMIKCGEHQTGDNNVRITFTARSMLQLTRKMLYDSEGEKIIHKNFLHLPEKKMLAVIKGILETDGHKGEKLGEEISLEMSSRNVIESVRYMMLKLKSLTSGYERDRIGNVSSYKNITTTKKTWVLRIPRIPKICEMLEIESGKKFTSFEYEGFLYTRITKLTHKKFKGTLIDLVVDNNHNYLTHGGLAHNGGGKRKGAISLSLQSWHGDLMEFLDIRTKEGVEELKARDIFPALFHSDIFFKRLIEQTKNEAKKNNKDVMWSLFCPGSYPELITLCGEEFETRYLELENKKKYVRQVKMKDVWSKIVKSLQTTGLPYMLSKDNINHANNQENIGPITSSNLCCEIVEHHSPSSIACCNLSSIAYPKFVDLDKHKYNYLKFDYDRFGKVIGIMTENCNLVIDKNFYSVKSARLNNMKNRPIGLGGQGLADSFAMISIPWESQDAIVLNRLIFEHQYYYAVKKSTELAEEYGSYENFEGSPASKGFFQFDMWKDLNGQKIIPLTSGDKLSAVRQLLRVNSRSSPDPDTSLFIRNAVESLPTLDWEDLRKRMMKGMRNSLLIAPMPTMSTSGILGNNEAFEPFTSNIYAKKIIAGDFPMVNKHLYKALKNVGLWNKQVVDQIIKEEGSVQNIKGLSDHLKKVFKTVWEIPQKLIIEMAADRGAFIDQSQSMNIFLKNPVVSQLTTMYIYCWQLGLKTLSYYLHSQASVEAVKFTLMEVSDPTEKIREKILETKKEKESASNLNLDSSSSSNNEPQKKHIICEESCSA